MKKRTVVTQVMSDEDFQEREELIQELHRLGRSIATHLGENQNFLTHVGESRILLQEETYEQPRLWRKPATRTRTVRTRTDMVTVMRHPHIWVTMDGRYAWRTHANDIRLSDLSDLHLMMLRGLLSQARDIDRNLTAHQ